LQQKAKKLKFGKSHLSNWKKGGVCHHLLLHLPLAPIPLNYGPGVKHVKKNWLNNFFNEPSSTSDDATAKLLN